MADDLVAELTLRINNQLNAGLGEVRGDFSMLEDGTEALRESLLGVGTALDDLHAPAGLAGGMQGFVTETGEAITAVNNLGAAIDDDEAKLMALYASAGQWGQFAVPPQPGDEGDPNRPAFVPPGTPPPSEPPPPSDDDEDDDNPRRPRPGHGKPLEAPGSYWVMELLALATGYVGEKDYAKFQETALQAAIIEGYSGKAAMQQAHQIMHESYNQAYLSRGNVDDIEEAYFNLLRQKLPKDLVNQMMGPLTEAATTYNTPVADLTQPMYNLADQFQIPGDQMTQAVAILGAASHMGHYYFSDFGNGLPQISSQFNMMGDTGIKGEATAAAALEIVRRGTPDSGTAATDLGDLMSYMASPMAIRFFDRTKRSQDLLGQNILDLFHKYDIHALNIPKYFNDEREKGIDPLNAMVDYMHSIGAEHMSPTDQMIVFRSLFHNQEAATAMLALEEHYNDVKDAQGKVTQLGFKSMELALADTAPGFLDENFRTAIQGNSSSVSSLDVLGTYMYRLYGQNTWGLFGQNDAPSQADANKASPGSNAFNIPITLNVTVDKSGNVTAAAAAGPGPRLPAPGTSVTVNQGQVLGVH